MGSGEFDRLKEEALKSVAKHPARPQTVKPAEQEIKPIPTLTNCPACSKSVSSAAQMCPGCGHPMIAAAIGASAAVGHSTVTIQQTSKTLKLQVFFSVILILIGIMMLVSGSVYSFWVLLAGLLGYILSKFRIWWHHK